MKKLLIASLLIASSNAYAHDTDPEIIELDDFQDMNRSSYQYPNYETYHGPEENIEEVLRKHWEENTYTIN